MFFLLYCIVLYFYFILLMCVSICSVKQSDEADNGQFGQHARTYNRLFDLLSCKRVVDAVNLAEKAGMFRLATLLSQVDGDSTVPILLRNQLEMWKVSEADLTIAPELVRLYRLLAGTAISEDSQGQADSCLTDLGWLRGIGVLFWYCSSTDSFVENISTLSSAIDSYRIALQDNFADPPVSPYLRDTDRQGADVSYPATATGLYTLLELFFPSSSNVSMDLDNAALELDIRNNVINALRPSGYTRDALDYRASYMILVMLESAGISHISSTHACIIRQHYISQLLSAGLWRWALFVALQLPDPSARYCVINDIIMRFGCEFDWDAESSTASLRPYDSLHVFLTNALSIPETLLHESEAYFAGYRGLYYKQVNCLISAKMYELSTEITVTRIAPMALLSSDAASSQLLKLLETISGLSSQNTPVSGTTYSNNYTKLSDVFLTFLRLKDAICRVNGVEKSSTTDMVVLAMEVPELVREARELIGRITAVNQLRKAIKKKNRCDRKTKTDLNERYIDIVLFDMCTYLYNLVQSMELATHAQEDGPLSNNSVQNLLSQDALDWAPILNEQLAATTASCNHVFLQHAASCLVTSQS